MGKGMAARLSMLFPRLVALTLIWLLATSTVTFAAGGRAPRKAVPVPAPAPKAAPVLIVPDVRRQAYVFAKGILEDGGFAWRVTGGVQGYAANTVASQEPAPGTRVLDNGSPRITLRLARNSDYTERGLPENSSSHRGTKVVLASEAAKAPTPAAARAPQPPPAKKDKQKSSKPAQPAPAAADARKAAFHAPGAPAEPLDELPLPERARLVETRLAGAARPTPALVKFWLFQHAWIVTGAKFGWSGGAEALETIIAVDEDLQARWGIGARSEAVARTTLADVERQSR